MPVKQPGDDRPEGARTVSTERLYEGKVLSLDIDVVEEPGNVKARREVIRQGSSAAILPVHDDGRVILIRQWRHAVQEMLWEVPAGRLDGDEAPEHGARRELAEEIAMAPAQLELLASFWPTPGVCTERMYLFRATGLTACESHPDADERIETHTLTLEEAREMVRTGVIHEAKTMIAILLESERRASGRA
jgi:ADP-ribose pyrophosphatase